MRIIKNQVLKAENRIHELEQKLEEMNKLMAQPEKIEDHKQFAFTYKDIETQLEEEMQHWETINIQLEELTGKGF